MQPLVSHVHFNDVPRPLEIIYCYQLPYFILIHDSHELSPLSLWVSNDKKSSKHTKKKQKKDEKEKKKKKKHHHHHHHSDGGEEESTVQNGTVEEEEPLPVSV